MIDWKIDGFHFEKLKWKLKMEKLMVPLSALIEDLHFSVYT